MWISSQQKKGFFFSLIKNSLSLFLYFYFSSRITPETHGW